MRVTTHFRGHAAEWDARRGQFVWADTGEPARDRPCVRCGHMPLSDGEDACIGHVPGAEFACCGHGVERPYVMAEWGWVLRHWRTLRLGYVLAHVPLALWNWALANAVFWVRYLRSRLLP